MTTTMNAVVTASSPHAPRTPRGLRAGPAGVGPALLRGAVVDRGMGVLATDRRRPGSAQKTLRHLLPLRCRGIIPSLASE